jgi:endonuclease YncB( thermonuclease family)
VTTLRERAFPATRAALLGGLLALALSASFAAEMHGVVVAISDGDTLTVLDDSKTQHKIRLLGIDAPERTQAFSRRSRQSLADLTFQREVAVDWQKRDRFGRIVGKVLLDGVDVNLLQIKRGFAWHYKEYQRDQTPEDRILYGEAEITARAAAAGLWADAAPVPPWEFRRVKQRQTAPPQRHSIRPPPSTGASATSGDSEDVNNGRTCFVGPRGGTYTITASGRKNYAGC